MIHHTYLWLDLLGSPRRVIVGAAQTGWSKHQEEDQAWMTFEYGGASAHPIATFAVDNMRSASGHSLSSFSARTVPRSWTFVLQCSTGRSACSTLPTRPTRRATEMSSTHSPRRSATAVPQISTLEDAAVAAGLVDACRRSAESSVFIQQEQIMDMRW